MVAHEPSLAQLRAREDGAFVALVDQYYAAIYRYLYRLTQDPHVAADLTQDTFLDAFIALPRLTETVRLNGWMFRIATNNANSHFRRVRRFRWLPLDWRIHQTASYEELIADYDLVSQAMATLTNDQRNVLLLHAWLGFACAEIGEMIHKREDAVKMTLSRARRRFRDAYVSLGGDVDGEVEL